MDLLVGLDGVFRLTKLDPADTVAPARGEGIYGESPEHYKMTTSVKGGRQYENTFQTSFRLLGFSFSTRKDVTFSQDGVAVRITNYKDNTNAVTLHVRPQGS